MNARRRRILQSWLLMSMAAATSPEAMAEFNERHAGAPARRVQLGTSWRAVPVVRDRALEQIGGEYIEALNGGETAIAAFYARHADPGGPGQLQNAARWARTVELSRRYRPLDVYTVTWPRADLVTMLARSEQSGEWVYVSLLIDGAPPHLLIVDRIDPRLI
jgi:hypothetical protein